MKNKNWINTTSMIVSLAILAGCASAVPMKTQQYAELGSSRMFEYDVKTVWKAMEEQFRNYKIIDRNPEEVAVNEWSQLKSRTLTTDWILTESRDKYVEYSVNGSPRRKPLRVRLKYVISVNSKIGGALMSVAVKEEIEKLAEDGSSLGFEATSSPDSARAAEVLDKTYKQILAAPVL